MEERAEYIEEQKEKNMIAQCAHRGASKLAWRMSGPNGDVVTWPSLPRVYDRLKYITNGLDGAEIAQKIGSTRHAVYQQLGRAEKLSKEILAKYAQAFGCPLPWLMGETKKPKEAPEPVSVIRPKPAVRIEINGTFPIETILQMLPQGGYFARKSFWRLPMSKDFFERRELCRKIHSLKPPKMPRKVEPKSCERCHWRNTGRHCVMLKGVCRL